MTPPDLANNPLVRWVGRHFKVTPHLEGQQFFISREENGRLVRYVTPLFLVLVLVEFSDIIFAVDSIPAIFAVTSEPFLVFTANAFAILGLRAMYFLLADLMYRFVYLKIGLAFVLVWVGVKMGLHDIVKVPTGISLTVILTILTVSIVASFIVSRNKEAEHIEPASRQQLPEATEEEMAALAPTWRKSGKM